MKIVTIIPTYNEKGNIENTIKKTLSVSKNSKNTDFHILITDGNSPDKTADLVRSMMKNNHSLHLILEKGKRGLGAAYKDAMDYAFGTMKADAIITMDADLSHDINVIPKFIDELNKGADYVCGTRYRKGGGIPPEWGLHRKFLSYGSNLFMRTLYLNSGLSDFTSGFKAFNKKVYYDIKDKIGAHTGYTFAIAGNLEPIRKGYKPVEIPYHFVDRKIGDSKMGMEYIFNAFGFVIKARIIDIYNSRFGKVFIAGGIGAIAQLSSWSLIFYPLVQGKNIFGLNETSTFLGIEFYPQYLISTLLSIEVGVIVSFSINNRWAFGDKRLKGFSLLKGFIKNQFVVAGAILIQIIFTQLCKKFLGGGMFFEFLYQTIGILLGLLWNFYFYKKLIWKVKKET